MSEARGRVATRRTYTTAEVLPRANQPCRRWMAVVIVAMARKKHSAKSGGRVRKGVVKPPNAIRRGEIVEEIVDQLRRSKDRMRGYGHHRSESRLLGYVPAQPGGLIVRGIAPMPKSSSSCRTSGNMSG